MEQKFQIGDICKIIKEGNIGFNLYVMILGSEKQIFPNLHNDNTENLYQVVIPAHLNQNVYVYDNDRNMWDYCIPNISIPSTEQKVEFNWRWIRESDIEFVRKPNKEDLMNMCICGSKLKWNEYNKENPDVWTWNSWEQMAKNYIDLNL